MKLDISLWITSLYTLVALQNLKMSAVNISDNFSFGT